MFLEPPRERERERERERDGFKEGGARRALCWVLVLWRVLLRSFFMLLLSSSVVLGRVGFGCWGIFFFLLLLIFFVNAVVLGLRCVLGFRDRRVFEGFLASISVVAYGFQGDCGLV